jgi:hypothetical protein
MNIIRRFAFITRHAPTPEQNDLAAAQNIALVPVGDIDAFGDLSDLRLTLQNSCFEGVVVVHPWLALALAPDYPIGVFENANRAAEGEKPSFYAKGLHVNEGIARLCDLTHKLAGELKAWQRGELY